MPSGRRRGHRGTTVSATRPMTTVDDTCLAAIGGDVRAADTDDMTCALCVTIDMSARRRSASTCRMLVPRARPRSRLRQILEWAGLAELLACGTL